MAKNSKDKQLGKEEISKRLSDTLKGAFGGPPTPLKNIPKKRNQEPKKPEKSGSSKKL